MYGQNLLSNSARATSRTESKYRIDYPLVPTRGARVIALDGEAEKIIRRTAKDNWKTAHFFVVETAPNPSEYIDDSVDVILRSLSGETIQLKDELNGVDVVIMVATTDTGSIAASTIAAACTVRGIMTAGIIVSTNAISTVAALRPHARILLISAGESDLDELLSAIRA